MRWWPRTLFGRLLLILLGGLLFGQLLSSTLHWNEREAFVFRISTARSAQRVVDLLHVLETLTPSERQRVVAQLGSPGFGVALDAPAARPDRATDPELTGIFSEMLRHRLPAGRPLAVAVTKPDRRTRSAAIVEASREDEREHYLLSVWTRLADGTPVEFDLAPPQRQPGSRPLLLHLGILSAVMVVLIYFAVRWVTRPLSTLANAAEELGRNINRTPLDETGPAEVRLAAHAFNSMQERLLRYVRTREQVLAAMSHDLKTPITRMRLRTALMDEPELKAKFEADLDEMQAMVGATLNLMRGLDSEEALQPVDVGALLESIVFDYQAMGHAVELACQVRHPLPARPQAIKRCLQNLVDNAVKYGGAARVEAEEDAGRVVIRVIDEGPGIPESDLKRVFDPYYRVESSRNRQTGGHGLGLTIACNIAESHGGSIELANRPGGGLQVSVAFPRGSRRAEPT